MGGEPVSMLYGVGASVYGNHVIIGFRTSQGLCLGLRGLDLGLGLDN